MKWVTILDSRSTVLPFDLRHLLVEVAPETSNCIWRVSPGIECYGPAAAKLEQLSQSSRRLVFDELIEIAQDILQVVDGEFSGYSSKDEAPMIILRAVDSTYWDVGSTDECVLERLKSRFMEYQESLHSGRR